MRAHLDDPHLVGVVDDGDLLGDALPRRAREHQLGPRPLSSVGLSVKWWFKCEHNTRVGLSVESSVNTTC